MVVRTATNRKGCGSSVRLRAWCGTEPRPRSVAFWPPRRAVCTHGSALGNGQIGSITGGRSARVGFCSPYRVSGRARARQSP